MVDEARFNKAREMVLGNEHIRTNIGTYKEKSLHSILKYYYQPDDAFHEVKTGSFVADVFRSGSIIEIQTGSFSPLKAKLETFTALTPTTIVHPIHNIKWTAWINPKTGEVSKKHKSPRKGSAYDIFPELYSIRKFLLHPNLRVKIAMIDLIEYRYLDGWSRDKKRGSHRCDRIPLKYDREINLYCPEDYQLFIPDSLNRERFTSKDYSAATGIRIGNIGYSLGVMCHLGLFERIGKEGNSYIYKVIEPNHDE